MHHVEFYVRRPGQCNELVGAGLISCSVEPVA